MPIEGSGDQLFAISVSAELTCHLYVRFAFLSVRAARGAALRAVRVAQAASQSLGNRS